MIVIADTNIIIRLLVRDDESQFKSVSDLFRNAEEIIIPTTVYCEVAWVLSASYRIRKVKLLETLRKLLASKKISVREDEIEAGLSMMEEGGDFADGVNAYAGQAMAHGSAVFASFDKRAVRLLTERGISAMVPG